MSLIKSTAFERSVIALHGGLTRFYGIPALALGPYVVLSYDLRPDFSQAYFITITSTKS